MKRRVRRAVAASLAAGMMAGAAMSPFTAIPSSAQQVSGDGPFINSWLVSGPFEKPVADIIYGTEDGMPLQKPADGNWAKVAQVSSSSVWQSGIADYPDDTNRPEEKFKPERAVDGDKSTAWVPQLQNTLSNDPKDWPKWDPDPTMHLSWRKPISVKTVNFYNRIDYTMEHVKVVLKDADGKELKSLDVKDTPGKGCGTAEFDTVVEGVSKVELHIVYSEKKLEVCGTGFTEVEVFDGEETIEQPEDGNWAKLAQAESSSVWQKDIASYPDDTSRPEEKFKPASAIDGNMSTSWVPQLQNTLSEDPADWPGWDPDPTMYLSWGHPVSVKTIKFYNRNGNVMKHVKAVLKDAEGKELKSLDVKDTPGNGCGVADFGTAVDGVSKVELHIVYTEKNIEVCGTGFSEVEVYGDAAEKRVEDRLNETGERIVPALGDTFGTDGSEDHAWEYFDDRLWNRSYDDYQDLNGYYSIKKGVDTKNKFVYAHTYVYSEKEQSVELRVGSSGSFRAYVNDELLDNESVPAEVQKDMKKLKVTLKKGWNKVLLQIEHTYTDDCNANGIPVAKDYDVSYLGFYARLTTKEGKKPSGIVVSTSGPKEELQIVTQGLQSKEVGEDGMGLPENELPIGYKEWPYVWNKSVHEGQHGLSASAFQFEAGGGTPGYKWEIVEGKLPDGLELNEDGTIADGLKDGKADLAREKGFISIDCEEGDYPFTVRVTDADGKTAEKEFEITVKERPNKWFEEGRVGALSHCIAVMNWFIDPNFSADLWAERAKAQGHSLVSVEGMQQNYYWPSRFADPNHRLMVNMPKDEEGRPLDGLKVFEEAVKRYGMKFGVYYASEGGGWQHCSTDSFVQDTTDLIKRYNPDYLYFDGPQAMQSKNFDVMYSNVRNYSNDIIINANTYPGWGGDHGDADLRTVEGSGIYQGANYDYHLKRTVMEPWKSLISKNNPSPWYDKRDDYRQVTKEIIMNAGRGMVDNNDQSQLMGRGPDFNKDYTGSLVPLPPSFMPDTYPIGAQEFIDARDGLVSWFAPEGKPERHESTTGTTPYFLNENTCNCKDDGKGNYSHFEAGHGPAWGYATSRDNNIYLHIMEGPDGKKGFDAISGKELTVSSINDKVKEVIWLNEDKKLDVVQKGDSVSINLDKVTEDPIDTIIKIVTDSKDRKYELTNLYLEGKQLSEDSLQIMVEGQMIYPALKAELSKVTFESQNANVAKVNKDGVVSYVSDGTTTIMVKGTYEDVTLENSIQVTCKDGMVYVGEKMNSAVLHVNNKEAYGELPCYDEAVCTLQGRSEKGGAIGLDAATVTWHTGVVHLEDATLPQPMVIEETDIMEVKDGVLTAKAVTEKTRAVVWADVELDGQKCTTNRVFLDLMPGTDLAKKAEVTSSHNKEQLKNLTDGKAVDGIRFDQSKWSAPKGEASDVTFKFDGKQTVNGINITFNTLDQRYLNTPKQFEIQTSEDGENWETISTQNGPTGHAWFGYYDSYSVEAKTEYLRLHFTGEANGASIDIMEVAVNGIEEKPVQKPADKSLLQATYDYALTLPTDGVVDSAVKFFEEAKAEAKAVLDNPDATQEEVNAAFDKLYQSIHGLGVVQGDKTNLKLLIDRAEAMMAEQDRYVQKNWQQLVDALEAAKVVMEDGDALEEDVQKAVDDLLNAILAQRYKANKDNLQNIIDKAEGLDLSKYTKESVAVFKKALKDAKAVMADENLSEDDQKTVDKAVKDLDKAIEGLKLASDDSDDNNGGNNNGESNNNGNKPADRNPDAGDKTPKTGDLAQPVVWNVLVGAAGAVLAFRRKEKR